MFVNWDILFVYQLTLNLKLEDNIQYKLVFISSDKKQRKSSNFTCLLGHQFLQQIWFHGHNLVLDCVYNVVSFTRIERKSTCKRINLGTKRRSYILLWFHGYNLRTWLWIVYTTQFHLQELKYNTEVNLLKVEVTCTKEQDQRKSVLGQQPVKLSVLLII